MVRIAVFVAVLLSFVVVPYLIIAAGLMIAGLLPGWTIVQVAKPALAIYAVGLSFVVVYPFFVLAHRIDKRNGSA